MSSIRAEVGSLASLFAFEAAGRLASFTRAASELGVTQAAVSKQIAILEESLETVLFIRSTRHVELTASGRDLFATITISLGSIADKMRELRQFERPPLTVAMSMPLSQFWFMPLLPRFTEAHPDTPVRIVSQDDLSQVRGADVLIRFYRNGPPGALRLFEAEVQAVAAQRFIERYDIKSASDVLAGPMISYDTPDRSWRSWTDWIREARLQYPRSLRPLSVSRYQDAIVAARQGQGSVLAWRVNGTLLSFGSDLVPVPGPVLRADGAFFLEILEPAAAGIDLFAAWLTSVVQQS